MEEKKVQADVQGDGSNAEEPKKLSQAQKKKLKEKLKKEAAAKEAAEKAAAGEAVAEPTPAAAKGGKGKKKMNAAAALALEKKRLLEEANEAQRKEEERIRLEEERIQKEKDEEERKIREAAEAIKKEKKDIIQKKKDAGEWLSKKQLAKKRAMEEKRKQLIAEGTLTGEQSDSGDENVKHTKVVRNRGKNKKNKPAAQQEAAETEEKTEVEQPKKEEVKKETQKKPVEEEKKEEEEDSDAIDDWENADLDEIADKMKDKDGALPKMNDEEDNAQVLADKEKEEKQKKTQQVHNAPGAGKKKKNKKEEADDAGNIFEGADQASKAERMKQRKEENLRRQQARQKKQKDSRLRCPIVCILGHVDTGKTLILDKLRKTNVQAGEAGGITQQIGATYFPRNYIEGHVEKVKGRIDIDLKLPGFLVIDTPGHESFTNLRSRGSSLCDIAILVVDLMHGLEQQTLESIELLRQKKTPFIIALNKIDRVFEWKSKEYNNVRDSLDVQASHSITEFQDRVQKTILAFAEQGFNACLYWENDNVEEFVSLCPTSAITGEGLPDLMTYLSLMCQTRIAKQLYEREEFECTTLEVKVIEGLGTTIDVVLVNGVLKVGDTIVLQGFNGPIVTQIRALLTPQPMRELRVKAEYVHHQKIKGAMGIKIAAPGLEHAIAGSELLKANNEEEIQDAMAEIEDNLIDILDRYVDKTKNGVCVQASTLGSMEALLEFLKTSNIPVSNISIGPVHKKDVMRAMKVLATEETAVQKEFATILAFDVKVMPDAQAFADQEGIKIFTANIIYHLFDEFTAYLKACQDARKSEGGVSAIFPCALEIVKDAIFNRQNPIIIGVNVKAGQLKVGTPLCIPEKDNLKIGVVESIEMNKKSVQKVLPKDGSVAIRVSGQVHVAAGRHFDESNQVCSWLTRKSIDSLKEFFRDEMTMDDWKLVKALKSKYHIE